MSSDRATCVRDVIKNCTGCRDCRADALHVSTARGASSVGGAMKRYDRAEEYRTAAISGMQELGYLEAGNECVRCDAGVRHERLAAKAGEYAI
ncbi:hypothetical protein ACFLQN_02795 [Candidatus Aenigmatarchaeota archaeon]